MKNPGGGAKLKKSNTVEDLVELIGLPATLYLARNFGGRALRIPSQSTPDSPLAVAIGALAVSTLCSQYRGEYLNIPSESTVQMQFAEQLVVRRSEMLDYRNQLIRQHVAAGGKILRVALRFQLSRKMIRKIIGPRKNGPTLPRTA